MRAGERSDCDEPSGDSLTQAIRSRGNPCHLDLLVFQSKFCPGTGFDRGSRPGQELTGPRVDLQGFALFDVLGDLHHEACFQGSGLGA